ncbi:MAG: hypothetical protein CMH83_23785 [Nocardioides sp.]|nr:hypothetical protein [Nocardioides sp.]
MLHAGVAVSVVLAIDRLFLAHEAEAIYQLRGAWGEDNTRDVLSGCRWRRIIWGWVDSVTFPVGDIDHVVVTRRGGVVAIDSKWRNSVTSADVADMARSARRSATRTDGLIRSVTDKGRRTRHRGTGSGWQVRGVVVLWGASQEEVPKGYEQDGVAFVAGRGLRTWLAGLDGDEVGRPQARDLVRRLRRFEPT